MLFIDDKTSDETPLDESCSTGVRLPSSKKLGFLVGRHPIQHKLQNRHDGIGSFQSRLGAA